MYPRSQSELDKQLPSIGRSPSISSSLPIIAMDTFVVIITDITATNNTRIAENKRWLKNSTMGGCETCGFLGKNI